MTDNKSKISLFLYPHDSNQVTDIRSLLDLNFSYTFVLIVCMCYFRVIGLEYILRITLFQQ